MAKPKPDLDFDELMQDDPDMIIPFGKYEGKYASQINIEYLEWLIRWCNLENDFKKRLIAHIKNRRA